MSRPNWTIPPPTIFPTAIFHHRLIVPLQAGETSVCAFIAVGLTTGAFRLCCHVNCGPRAMGQCADRHTPCGDDSQTGSLLQPRLTCWNCTIDNFPVLTSGDVVVFKSYSPNQTTTYCTRAGRGALPGQPEMRSQGNLKRAPRAT